MNRQEISDIVLRRVYSEFLEMPGLRLTRQQAQRLWGLDEQTCVQLLEFLVEAKFLRYSSQGLYTRLTDGPPHAPRPRLAKAGLAEHRMEIKRAV